MMLRLNFPARQIKLARSKFLTQFLLRPHPCNGCSTFSLPILLGPAPADSTSLPTPLSARAVCATNYSNYAIARCKEQILATS